MNRLFLFLYTALAATTASAQSSQDPIDQIIVSAARTPLTLRQTGAATTVIGRTDIEQREARTVSELLRSVPGFAVSQTGVAGSQTQVRVRGAEANHVLVLIDGVRANDPATGDEFRWEYLSTSNIERIEIVRGPQSALWGSDAVAAIVHIVTRSGTSGRGVDGYLEGGSNSTTNAGLNGAVGGERWSLSASAERLQTDGSNISRSGGEDDDADLTTGSLSLTVDASDAVELRFGLRGVDAYSQFDAVDFLTSLPSDSDVATDAETYYINAGVAVETMNGDLTHAFDIRYFDSDNSNLVGGVENSGSAADRISFAYQGDIRLRDNVLSLALEHEQTDFSQTGDATFGDPNQNQSIDASSLSAEYQNHTSEKLSWILSARFDSNSDFDDALNGRASVAYRMSDDMTLRAAVGTGRKNPTFTERFGFFPGTFLGNPDLEPESSTSFDLGLERHLMSGNVTLRASLFHQDLDNEINGFAFDAPSGMFTAINIDGESERSGVELETIVRFSDSFDMAAHYTYTDAQEDSGSREIRRPKHAGGINANLRALNDRFGAALTANYGGSRGDVFFDPATFASTVVPLESYWLVDLALHYDATDTVTLFVRGNNLTDDDYEEVLGYRTLGRTGYAGVRVNFGGGQR